MASSVLGSQSLVLPNETTVDDRVQVVVGSGEVFSQAFTNARRVLAENAEVNGTVYQDLNANGQQDAGDLGRGAVVT